jgi:hypothetical protein
MRPLLQGGPHHFSAWSPARRSSSTTPRRRRAEFTGAVIGRGSGAPSLPPISAPAREAAPRWSASRYGIEPGRGRGARGGSAPRPRAGPSREARSSPTGRVRRAAQRARAPADCAGSGLRPSRGSAVSPTHAGGGGSREASRRRVQQGCVVACGSRCSVVAPTRPPRTWSATPVPAGAGGRLRPGPLRMHRRGRFDAWARSTSVVPRMPLHRAHHEDAVGDTARWRRRR